MLNTNTNDNNNNNNNNNSANENQSVRCIVCFTNQKSFHQPNSKILSSSVCLELINWLLHEDTSKEGRNWDKS